MASLAPSVGFVKTVALLVFHFFEIVHQSLRLWNHLFGHNCPICFLDFTILHHLREPSKRFRRFGIDDQTRSWSINSMNQTKKTFPGFLVSNFYKIFDRIQQRFIARFITLNQLSYLLLITRR